MAGALLTGSGIGTGSAAAASPCSPDTEGVAAQWRETVETDSGALRGFKTQPVVTDDAVIVAAANTGRGYCSPEDSNPVVSLDRSTREPQWSTDLGMPVTHRLDRAAGTVLAETPDGLFALDAADGSLRWQLDDDVSVTTAFVGDDDTVYAPITGSSGDASLVALDLATGTERWRFDGADGALSTIDELAIGGGQVYAETEIDGEDAFVAVDAATGDPNWRVTDASGKLVGASNGLVFTSSIDDYFTQPELVVRSASDGSGESRTDIDRGISDVGVASTDDTVFVPNTGFGGLPRGVDAVDLVDGSVRWSNGLTEFQERDCEYTTDPYGYHTAAPVVTEGALYLSYERYVIALDPTDGTVLNYYEGVMDVAGIAPRDDYVYATDVLGWFTGIDPLA